MPKTVLLTGCNSGIGLALLRALLKTDFRVVATVRQKSMEEFFKLEFQECDRLIVRPLDLCEYEQSVSLIKEIDEKFGGVDILINNAGISYRSVVEHMSPPDDEHQLRVNYLGPFNLIRNALKTMREKKSGKIINISSVGGMMAMPTMSAYSASKFALEGASEALWYEVRPWNITVTLVQLGFVSSKSFQNVILTKRGLQATKDKSNPYHHHYKHMSEFIEKLMLHSFSSPEKIAKKILKVINSKSPPLRVSGTSDARFFLLLRRLLPRFIYHYVLYKSLPRIQKWGPQK